MFVYVQVNVRIPSVGSVGPIRGQMPDGWITKYLCSQGSTQYSMRRRHRVSIVIGVSSVWPIFNNQSSSSSILRSGRVLNLDGHAVYVRRTINQGLLAVSRFRPSQMVLVDARNSFASTLAPEVLLERSADS